MEWIAHLGSRNLQPKTIKSYLTAVRSLHIEADAPFSVCESPIVQRLIRGIKRYHGERERSPKLPITFPILLKLTSLTYNSFDDIVFVTAAKLAYAGFLRCGEFTIDKPNSFDPNIHVTRSSIRFMPSTINPDHVILTLPASKTDPFRKGVTIYISSAPNSPSTCPVSALLHLFTVDPRPLNSPLFITSDHNPLTRSRFIARLHKALLDAGLQPHGYSGHSFRRGAASAAAAAGFLDHEIQQLGRWRSDAYRLYIDTPKDRILNLSSRLHMADPHVSSFEPPSLRFTPSLA